MSQNDYKKSLSLLDLFADSVMRFAQGEAVWCNGKSISYAKLDELSDEICQRVLEVSESSQIFGISTSRCIEEIAGLIGILKAGKAYLPLDIGLPRERVAQIIKDSGIDGCIVNDQEEEGLFKSLGIRVLGRERKDKSAGNKKSVPGKLAYVLYTSGSTGKPKGVLMGEAAMINLIQWQQRHSSAGAGTRTLQFAPLSFDVSFQEIFSTLTTGGTLVLIDDDTRLDPQRLLGFLREQKVSRIFVPFVALQYLTEAAAASDNAPDNNVLNNNAPEGLTEIMTAGEQLKITSQVRKFFDRLPKCKLYNQYGPTECHVVSESVLSGNTGLWPDLPSIGKAIDNTELFILDENLKQVSEGETGELCIAGKCLAEGYLNQPSLTREKFIEWEEDRIYRTGDLARKEANGEVEFLGRKDDQVKIRGYRIEPGEIEVLLNRQEGILQAVVIAREDIPGQKRLVAYLVPSTEKKDIKKIRKAIEKELPDYMMPSAFIWMDQLPKTGSGKIDKKSLPKPEIKRPELGTAYKAPVTEKEKTIAKVWAELLQIDRVGVKDNFFELGGNSLLALRTVTELRNAKGLELPVTKIYQFPSVEGIADFLEGKTEIRQKEKKNSRNSGEGNNREIAVIGMAGRFPGAENIQAFWKMLVEGREGIRFFTKEELSPFIEEEIKKDPDYVAARGILEGTGEFDAAFFHINPKMAALMDPQQRLFLQTAWEALESAGVVARRYEGLIGVYAGTGNNSYYINNVLPNKELTQQVGPFNVMAANEKDYVASRTAYELNLKGPAVSVYSACSTSLLAIAQAAESLREGHCDIALAGGVAVTSPIHSGHIFQEGAMLSRDGHCRSFDEKASGTVFSDGVGIVVLKRLEDARRDEDLIYAVIKGAGVNNDGGGKGSFMTPSAEGQAAAIRMAQEDGAVDPATVSYIETHGTATPLGDPIEIEGLSIAFGQQVRKQYCAIGSVKSNIGHLTAAAGVAGFIKTVLSLYTKKIPASIHFQKPNPNIDFANSPFFVNDRLRDWEMDGKAERRIAGISSFGVGGTNVHLVVEEFEVGLINSVPSRKPAFLFRWSAKSEYSLKEMAGRLADHLENNEGFNLADIAYTLQTGRESFPFRRFVVAAERGELIRKLRAALVSPSESGQLKEIGDEIVFSFPGQGSQYLNMGKQVYQNEPLFRAAVDECALLLEPVMGEDIRERIFAIGEQAAEEIGNTYYTQPALFVIEYAIARLWMSWGIRPMAFIGHSIGEFVAAHLSGIFSLEDGLKLIATRGRLMSEQPRGSMLAVRATFEEIEKFLSGDLSLAVVNSPGSCVVAGPTSSVELLSQKLNGLKISNRVLATSHAFHSKMMEPIVEPFEEVVAGIKLNIPRIPIVSTATGEWLKDEEAMSPAYWAGHLRSPVLFAAAVKTLGQGGKKIVIESGPKNVTASLIRQQSGNYLAVIASLDIQEGMSEYDSILRAMGQLWLLGIDIDWDRYYENERRIRVNLPGYVFDKTLYWVDPPVSGGVMPTVTVENNSIQTSQMRRDALIEKIKGVLENASGIDMQGASEDMNFIEMGFDSLLITQVALNLKKEFRAPVSFRQLNEEYSNLNRLAGYLEQVLPKEEDPRPVSIKQQQAMTGNNSTVIGLISQQMQLLAQQVALLQGEEQALPVKKAGNAGLSAEEIAELKKPFGATAKIERQDLQLSGKQEEFIGNLIREYAAKTAESKKYNQQNRATMADPRVVTGFRPGTKEIVYSIVVNRSKGSRLWDIDGNEYIDALNGFGSNFYGYQPDFITRAIQEQIEKGYEIGPQHELSGPVCKLICEFTGQDRAALCNTGSEAVLGAMRIARTVTGRSTIVAFSGSYHGILDEVIVRGTKNLKSFPAAPGITAEAVQNMLILEYGTEESLRIISERADEIAAVLVEPVQSRRPEFQPVEFLKELREITLKSGTALIFDEVITGFRMHPAGAQGLFGIRADIGAYGKVVGAGISIGVIAGKSLFMDALDGGFWQFGDGSVPESGVTYFAGTFVRHPLALAASKASLDYMKSKGPALQEGVNAKGKRLADRLNGFCERHGLPIFLTQFGSLWKIKFKEEIPFSELIFALMRLKGIHILDGFPCFMTEAHSPEEVDRIAQCFEDSVSEMTEAGFFVKNDSKNGLNGHALTSKNGKHVKDLMDDPPIAGARLGKDRDGNPAWFVADPKRPGKFLQVK
jgi:amino acid adenylation domain-containing protein